ncbi:MAG TPA: hypothetical protein VFB06_06420 [Streptosporangiaceae bacterium]|nr:hypothetical protein [Streptosporangiaceae bacterium]
MTTATVHIAIFIPVPVLSGVAGGALATAVIRLLGGRGGGDDGGQGHRNGEG